MWNVGNGPFDYRRSHMSHVPQEAYGAGNGKLTMRWGRDVSWFTV